MAAQRTSRSLERSAAITRLSAIHGHWAAQAIRRYRGPAPLSRSNCVALVNMRPERSGYNLNRLAAGKSFPAAIRESQERGVYDTTGWGEVISRLGRCCGGSRLLPTATGSSPTARERGRLYEIGLLRLTRRDVIDSGLVPVRRLRVNRGLMPRFPSKTPDRHRREANGIEPADHDAAGAARRSQPRLI